MDKKLHVLLVEDRECDIELIKIELRKEGIEFAAKCADTQEAFIKAIEEFKPDIIISDYKLPLFDGSAALEIAQAKCPDVPFIFLTGVDEQELAEKALRKGAADYITKDQRPRLVPAIKRALREAARRRNE